MSAWSACARCGGQGVIGADVWTGEGVECDDCSGIGIVPAGNEERVSDMTGPQAEQDGHRALLCARNCLLYENDPGPAMTNIGTPDTPVMVPRSEAWQGTYAMRLLVDCDGDLGRLLAAGRWCREELARRGYAAGSEGHEDLSRAADLCALAARKVTDAGGDRDDKARRRQVAACRYEGMVTALGIFPGVAEDSLADMMAELREIEQES